MMLKTILILLTLGIIEKLDYLVDLEVTAIWLTPFLESPMESGGYDITNYYKIQPIYGTMEDFKNLINTAHQKSIFYYYILQNK